MIEIEVLKFITIFEKATFPFNLHFLLAVSWISFIEHLLYQYLLHPLDNFPYFITVENYSINELPNLNTFLSKTSLIDLGWLQTCSQAGNILLGQERGLQ